MWRCCQLIFSLELIYCERHSLYLWSKHKMILNQSVLYSLQVVGHKRILHCTYFDTKLRYLGTLWDKQKHLSLAYQSLFRSRGNSLMKPSCRRQCSFWNVSWTRASSRNQNDIYRGLEKSFPTEPVSLRSTDIQAAPSKMNALHSLPTAKCVANSQWNARNMSDCVCGTDQDTGLCRIKGPHARHLPGPLNGKGRHGMERRLLAKLCSLKSN